MTRKVRVPRVLLHANSINEHDGNSVPRRVHVFMVVSRRAFLAADGRFGCGPSKVRLDQLQALFTPLLMGTSTAQLRATRRRFLQGAALL